MKEKLFAILLIAGILLVGGYLYADSSAEVSVRGDSEIEAIPDRAAVYIMIEVKGKTAQEAQEQQDIIKDNLLTELIKLGFERDEIQTSYYNVAPEYDWSGDVRKQDGFVGREQIEINLEDFDNVSSVVDVAIGSGAYVSGIHFELSQERQNEYKALALKNAGQDAKRKAEATAEGLGKSLGRLISVDSQDFNYYPMVYYETSLATADVSELRSAASNISPKNIDVRAGVSVRYKLGLF